MIFPSKAYLTIDDSASERMDDLTDFLAEQSIPALFFCRGDMLERHMDSAIRAVVQGFVLGNHTYSHQRSSAQDVDWIIADIERTEKLLDDVYHLAGQTRTGKYLRFPHMDRGTAGWIVDYDAYDAAVRADLLETFAGGLNVQSMDRPAPDLFAKKDQLQAYLCREGFSQPFRNVTRDWYRHGEAAQALDCLYTYSNCDWMVTERHRGKWPYQSLDDLIEKARKDPYLTQKGAVNVILAHDQAEIIDITIKLVHDLRQNGMEFLAV